MIVKQMEDKITWSDEALADFQKVPDFVRDMAKQMVEQFARDQKATQITPEILKKARAKFGM